MMNRAAASRIAGADARGPAGRTGLTARELILGGARSGKSTAAEPLARHGERVLFIATAEALDEGFVLETVGRLLDLIDAAGGRWILVSNEVGQGIVPASPLGREYRDVLGRVNQPVASRADKACLMVAGFALELKSLADTSRGAGTSPSRSSNR